MPKERAGGCVDLGFAKLVEVPEEFEHMGPAAPGEDERRAVVL